MVVRAICCQHVGLKAEIRDKKHSGGNFFSSLELGPPASGVGFTLVGHTEEEDY